jgi:hypothetical protein
VLTKVRLPRLYSGRSKGVNVATLSVLLLAVAAAKPRAQATLRESVLSCDDPRLVRLFTPTAPQLGRYEVCSSTEPLEALAPPQWPRRRELALDAFGSAGTYDRWAVRRLYGSGTALVARGAVTNADEFVSMTLISPYPDPTLERLLPGTLVIRFIVYEGARTGRGGRVDR